MMETNEMMAWLWLAFYGGAMGRTATTNLSGIYLLGGAIVILVLIFWMKNELRLRSFAQIIGFAHKV